MALPWIVFKRDASSNQAYTAQHNAETEQTLSKNFSPVPVFFPFFVFGSAWKHSTLAVLLKEFHPDLADPESYFECKEGAEDGVYVYPEPVRIGEVTFMLLILRKPSSEEDAAYMEMRRKVMMGLVMLSSVSCLCDENSQVLTDIKNFMQDYELINARPQLNISKLLVLIENTWLKTANFKKTLEQHQKQYGRVFETLTRTRSAIDSAALLTRIANLQFHEPFRTSRSHLFAARPYLQGFFQWTKMFTTFANLNLEFNAFVKKLPDRNSPHAFEEVNAELEKCGYAEIIRKSGKALPIVAQIQVGLSIHLSIDPDIIGNLKTPYEKAKKSIVVMVLMGGQGMGKSTLLNHITKFCTEMVQPPSIFETGNTQDHITKGGHVLSHPLPYRDKYLMLTDIEGLGGVETQDPAKKELQENLKSALLAVASVPCILVTNSLESMKFVQESIEKIAELHTDYGFMTERIHLLFHDKTIPEEHKSENIQFVQLVQRLNRDRFGGKEVIIMRNKPNFAIPNEASAQQAFLKSLLDDSLYVKKSALGVPETINHLLGLMQIILSQPSTDLSGTKLSSEDNNTRDKFVKAKVQIIAEIQKKTYSENNKDLLIYFCGKINHEFTGQTEADMAQMSDALKNHCRKYIDLELFKKKAEMKKIEEFYTYIRTVPQEEMKQNIESSVKYYYDSAWCVYDFRLKVAALKTEFKQVRSHFPESRPTIKILLATLKSNRGYYTKWSVGMVGVQVASLFVGGGLGVVGGKIIAGEAASIAISVGIGGVFGLGVDGAGGIARHNPKKAVQLVLKNWKVNEEVFRDIRANREHPYLCPEAKAPVVLFLGSATTLFWVFANTFVKNYSSLCETEAFCNESTQILPFDYIYPEQGLTRCYLICLRMEKPTSKHYSRVMKLAERIIPAASVTCLLIDDDPNDYALPLLRTLPQAINTHLVVVHKKGVKIGEVRQNFSRCIEDFTIKVVEKFNQEEQKEAIEVITDEIVKEFNKSSAQDYNRFRGRLVSLAMDQKAMKLVYVNSMWGENELSYKAQEAISVNEELTHLRLDAPSSVLLLIGSKTTSFWQLANALVRRIAPLTHVGFEAFKSNTYTQILPFDYIHPGLGHILTRSYIVCIRMKKKPTSKYYHVMMKIAETLIPAVSLSCLLVDNPTHYAQPLLCPQPAAEIPMATPRVMIIHRNNPAMGEFKTTLTQRGVNYGEKQVQSFTTEEINALTEEIKGEWDRAEVQNYGSLQAQAELLPALLR